MKIKELIKQLQAYNPEEEIYTSIDEEGNDFKQIDGVYYLDLDDERRELNNIFPVEKERVIVIYPT